jgi:polyphosphate kinase
VAISTPHNANGCATISSREVKPLLTPIGLDPAHPFPAGRQQEPQFRDRALGPRRVRARNERGDPEGAALLPRIIALPTEVAGSQLVRSALERHSRDAHEMFEGREIVRYSQFRVTRDADLWFDEEEVKNLRPGARGRASATAVRPRRTARGRRELSAASRSAAAEAVRAHGR